MSGSDLQAQITAAKAYEEFFVPALFGEWAPRVAAAARIRTGDHVLDVACGTGVLAREAASQVRPSGFVAAWIPAPACWRSPGRSRPESNGGKTRRRRSPTRTSVSTPW